MKKAGIVLDDWKVPVFKRHLNEAGFKSLALPGPLPGCSTLTVEYEWVHKLQPVVAAANEECRKGRP